jgi:hypothetical protein
VSHSVSGVSLLDVWTVEGGKDSRWALTVHHKWWW